MILFLDFDGVLHHFDCREGVLCHVPRFERVMRDFPEIEIVIASAWRKDHTLDEIRALFSEDIRNRIIGVTPTFDDDVSLKKAPRYVREQEILDWLNANNRCTRSWIALDDTRIFFTPNSKHLLYVDPESGFNDGTEKELRKRLRKEARS